eukprot:3798364-Pleurochrysis_carterae.AAC.1
MKRASRPEVSHAERHESSTNRVVSCKLHPSLSNGSRLDPQGHFHRFSERRKGMLESSIEPRNAKCGEPVLDSTRGSTRDKGKRTRRRPCRTMRLCAFQSKSARHESAADLCKRPRVRLSSKRPSGSLPQAKSRSLRLSPSGHSLSP